MFGDKEFKLTSEGKQIRKLVRDLEKNEDYESDDEERDPYASSVRYLRHSKKILVAYHLIAG